MGYLKITKQIDLLRKRIKIVTSWDFNGFQEVLVQIPLKVFLSICKIQHEVKTIVKFKLTTCLIQTYLNCARIIIYNINLQLRTIL